VGLPSGTRATLHQTPSTNEEEHVDLGDPVREIEVVPAEEPVTVPDEAPAEQPDEVPA
jgi:hypothetical protein